MQDATQNTGQTANITDPKLANYVKGQLSAGKPKEQIEQELLSKGWTREQLNLAFGPPAELKNSAQPAPAQTVNNNLLLKALTEDDQSLVLKPEWLDLLFRVGFSSIFLVNAIYALVELESFKKLLEANFIAKHIGFTGVLILFTALNDFVIGTLIMLGKKRKLVYLWASLWLLLIAGLKISNLLIK